jgi:hypothetical protein
METLIAWASKYSAPVLLLLCIGAALIFVLKAVTERTIEAEFARLSKELELKLERRSEFEQQVLLERYRLVSDFAARLSRITTDLNRARSRRKVKDLYDGNELLPLTAVYEDLAVKSFQLSTKFHKFFSEQANVVLRLANARTDEERREVEAEYLRNLSRLTTLVNEEFRTDRISW